jgi:hypothetical protein
MRIILRSQTFLVVVWASVLLAGCTTLTYRSIQDEFNKAVEADNVRTVEALGALTSSDAEHRYEDIAAKLDDRYISGLDDRFKPNAHALRAVAQWRSGRPQAARETALAGLKLSNVASSPRDRMVLAMIPAVVIDEELVAKFKAAGRSVSEADYNATYVKDFATAAAMLKEAAAHVDPATPETIVFYVHLQRWRVLQNWRVVISGIDGGRLSGADARDRAHADAKVRLGQDLIVEIKSEEQLVPADSPIRKAMEAIVLH